MNVPLPHPERQTVADRDSPEDSVLGLGHVARPPALKYLRPLRVGSRKAELVRETSLPSPVSDGLDVERSHAFRRFDRLPGPADTGGINPMRLR